MTDSSSPRPRTELRFPTSAPRGPWRWLARRALLVLGLVAVMVLVVFLDRSGYRDAVDGELSLLDSLYYATVSLSTAGYGDIVPVTTTARLLNTLVVAPLRIAVLIVIGLTILQATSPRNRERWLEARWRKTLNGHTIVVGYDTTGRSAARTLLRNGQSAKTIVVVDARESALADANKDGFASIAGDATRQDVLQRAEVERARQVIVATGRDDTAVMVTISARALNPTATITVSVEADENVQLLRHSGADVVVTSADAVGRLLGLSTISPALGQVLEDILTFGEGLEVAERPVLPREEGRSPRTLDDVVVAVVRDGAVRRYFDPSVTQLARGDRLIVVRPAEELPWAARPGAEE